MKKFHEIEKAVPDNDEIFDLPSQKGELIAKLETEIVNLSLTKNEALVLFEFLSRFSESDSKLAIEDQAEERVLWNLCCDLEKILDEPFQENYGALLTQARERVRDKNE